jgi:hypothetical protein
MYLYNLSYSIHNICDLAKLLFDVVVKKECEPFILLATCFVLKGVILVPHVVVLKMRTLYLYVYLHRG